MYKKLTITMILLLIISLSIMARESPESDNEKTGDVIAFSGILREGGARVNGTREFNFRIYTNETTETGEVALWSETHTLEVVDGNYSALLGSINPLANENLTFEDPYWIELDIEGDTMEPRKKLDHIPYSLLKEAVIDPAIEPVGVKPGMIMPFGSEIENIPEGWLLCDGWAYDADAYPELYQVIGENFGYGNGVNQFNVPDLRGMFLRGVDRGSGNDPEAADRTALHAGGNDGNGVGSYQADALQQHQHDSRVTRNDALRRSTMEVGDNGSENITLKSDPGYAHISISVDDVKNAAVAPETRPKNVYVNFIIKY